MHYTRYGIYYTPSSPEFAAAGAAWLGWDISRAAAVGSPVLPLVGRPRKYGFHATLKAPFELAAEHSEQDLRNAVRDLARSLTPVSLDGLKVSRLGAFLALTPCGDEADLKLLAGHCLTSLDVFRAPMSEAEHARKIRPDMSPVLVQNIESWGYAHVLEAFRYHMTLTGPVPKKDQARLQADLQMRFEPYLAGPHIIDSLTLVGERADGMFREIQRFQIG